MTIVYFMQRPGDRAIKIGCAGSRSSRGPYQGDLSAYIKGRARGGYELARTPGYHFVERWFHCPHAAAKIKGEWFSETRELLRDVDVIRSRGRVNGQPDEPDAGLKVTAAFWRNARLTIFKMGLEQFAELLGYSAFSVSGAEIYGSALTRCAGLDAAASRAGITIDLRALITEEFGEWPRSCAIVSAPSLDADHVSRYRTHIVRNCSVAA